MSPEIETKIKIAFGKKYLAFITTAASVLVFDNARLQIILDEIKFYNPLIFGSPVEPI